MAPTTSRTTNATNKRVMDMQESALPLVLERPKTVSAADAPVPTPTEEASSTTPVSPRKQMCSIEVNEAVKFLTKLVKQRCKGMGKNMLPAKSLMKRFSRALKQTLKKRYEDHWFPEDVARGSAFRCIRIEYGKIDSSIIEAARLCGIEASRLRVYFPPAIWIWVDPGAVACRIGDDGSVSDVFKADPSSAGKTAALVTPTKRVRQTKARVSSPAVSTPPKTAAPDRKVLLGPNAFDWSSFVASHRATVTSYCKEAAERVAAECMTAVGSGWIDSMVQA